MALFFFLYLILKNCDDWELYDSSPVIKYPQHFHMDFIEQYNCER